MVLWHKLMASMKEKYQNNRSFSLPSYDRRSGSLRGAWCRCLAPGPEVQVPRDSLRAITASWRQVVSKECRNDLTKTSDHSYCFMITYICQYLATSITTSPNSKNPLIIFHYSFLHHISNHHHLFCKLLDGEADNSFVLNFAFLSETLWTPHAG